MNKVSMNEKNVYINYITNHKYESYCTKERIHSHLLQGYPNTTAKFSIYNKVLLYYYYYYIVLLLKWIYETLQSLLDLY